MSIKNHGDVAGWVSTTIFIGKYRQHTVASSARQAELPNTCNVKVLPQSAKIALAIWGFVGDKLAEQVDLRVGFVHTDIPYLMVVWLKALTEEEKTAWVRKASALGPF